MTWAQPASWKPKIANQSRQATDRTRRVPAIGTLVHGTAAEQDHGRSRRSVRPGEGDDLICFKPRLFCTPMGSEEEDLPRLFLESSCVRSDKGRGVELLAHDDVHDGQREGGV
jgi:hypothetical protein